MVWIIIQNPLSGCEQRIIEINQFKEREMSRLIYHEESIYINQNRHENMALNT